MGLTGGEGTGKSNYIGSIIAGTLCWDDHYNTIDTLGTQILSNTEGKAVLLYDTEQSETQTVQKYFGNSKKIRKGKYAGLLQSLLFGRNVTKRKDASHFAKYG